MSFIYLDNRDTRQKKVIDATIRNNWTISDIFKDDKDLISSYKNEKERLKWAPILVALAFGEDTAFKGFGNRIAEAADDISTRSWLCAHLLDEAKHTEGFSRFLNYLYPSYKNRQTELFSSRDALLFYGHTHQSNSLTEWLLCTQIAEVFGRQCYKALYTSLVDDPIAEKFLKNIVSDEVRHIAYIGSLINIRRKNMSEKDWEHLKPFINKMIKLGQNMFEARKKGANYYALSVLNIDTTEFCNVAEAELQKKYL